MALIKCKECGKEFSDKATTCIHCGCPINNKDIKIEKTKNNKNKKISILDILRYIIGGFVLICSFTSVKGLGIIICLLSAIMIIPFTSKIIYSKVNIPKALKIIIPIICFILSLSIFPNANGTKQTLTCTLTADYEDYSVEGKQVFIFENSTLSIYDNNSYMKFNDTTTGEMMFKFLDQNTENFNKYEGVKYKVTFNVQNELRTTINVNVNSAPEMFVSFLSYDNINEKSSINDIKTALQKDKYSCTIK